MDLLDYYRDNLQYIRALADEFAAEFPKIAGRLSLSGFECQDPYIERLLEGTAFLSAKVEKKLDEGYQHFLESMLNSMAPSALYPIPSGAVLELVLNYSNERVRRGVMLEAGTIFDAFIPNSNTPCRFSSVDAVPLLPLSVAEEQYVTRDLASLGITNAQANAALRLKLMSTTGEPLTVLDELVFFVNMPEAETSLLQRQLMHDRAAVYVRHNNGAFTLVNNLVFDLPINAGSTILHEGLKGNVKGLRLLQNFMAYPMFFKFFSIKNLGAVFNATALELVIMFKRREPSLAIKAGALKLNCVPVLNIFTKRSDRIALDREAFAFHIVPERTAMRDYEVLSVQRLEFFNERNETLFFATNFYDQDVLHGSSQRNFFSQHRQRSLFERKSTQRSSYSGTELFVSFSAQNPNVENAYQFAAELICTNRDLPLLLQPDTSLTSNVPYIQSGVFIAAPTKPDYSLIARGDQSDFAKLSHIIFNLSSMLWQDGTLPLEMFKTMLLNYRIRSEEETERMIDGIISLESEPTTFRFIKGGAVFFEAGWKVRFTLDEMAYAGMGYYTFAFIIGEMLKSFTPLNTLLEIEFCTQQSGQIATWKTLEN
ncbi:MAG: type VI secretion system baseplate subunit TssF [Treponema sp.]|jgi:type VI secretion system VasI/ImpG family protein|nr:type VI secretion system baseplate subunit TssF [Treponema sp.]